MHGYNNIVNLLFLNGTNSFLSANACITSPNALNDLLICCASFNLCPDD